MIEGGGGLRILLLRLRKGKKVLGLRVGGILVFLCFVFGLLLDFVCLCTGGIGFVVTVFLNVIDTDYMLEDVIVAEVCYKVLPLWKCMKFWFALFTFSGSSINVSVDCPERLRRLPQSDDDRNEPA